MKKTTYEGKLRAGIGRIIGLGRGTFLILEIVRFTFVNECFEQDNSFHARAFQNLSVPKMFVRSISLSTFFIVNM